MRSAFPSPLSLSLSLLSLPPLPPPLSQEGRWGPPVMMDFFCKKQIHHGGGGENGGLREEGGVRTHTTTSLTAAELAAHIQTQTYT